MRSLVPILCLVIALAGVSRAEEPLREDPLELVALLLQDGHLDRAASVLSDIDPSSDALEIDRYWTLVGLTRTRQGLHQDAAAAFAAAVAASQTPVDPNLRLSLARAQVRAQDNAGALDSLAAAGVELDEYASRWLVAARAHWNLGQLTAAWSALEEGKARFPEQTDFPRQMVLLLVDMGLSQEAVERATSALAAVDGDAEDALTVAEALRRAGTVEPAIAILELARLRFPTDPRLATQLAAMHSAEGRPLAAARLLQIVAATDTSMADETAELFRRAGRMDAALMMNAEVSDAVIKVRQRFGLLLEAESWERASALEARLGRLGLLSDDGVKYGLAYARFQSGELEDAERLLAGIADAGVFRQATELRRAIDAARGDRE